MAATSTPHAEASSRTPSSWKVWWLAARPKTLTAAAVPVLVGLAIAPPSNAADAGIAGSGSGPASGAASTTSPGSSAMLLSAVADGADAGGSASAPGANANGSI